MATILVFIFVAINITKFIDSNVLEPYGELFGDNAATVENKSENINLDFKLTWPDNTSTWSIYLEWGCVSCAECGIINHRYCPFMPLDPFFYHQGQVFYRNTTDNEQLSRFSQQIKFALDKQVSASNALIVTWVNCSILKKEDNDTARFSKPFFNTFQFIYVFDSAKNIQFTIFNYEKLELNAQTNVLSGFQYTNKYFTFEFQPSTAKSNSRFIFKISISQVLEPYGDSAEDSLTLANQNSGNINLDFQLFWPDQVSTSIVNIQNGCVECSDCKILHEFCLFLVNFPYFYIPGLVFYRNTSDPRELSALSEQINLSVGKNGFHFNASKAFIVTWVNCLILNGHIPNQYYSNTFQFVYVSDTERNLNFAIYNYDKLEFIQQKYINSGYSYKNSKFTFAFRASTANSNVNKPGRFIQMKKVTFRA